MPKISKVQGPSNASEARVDVQEPILAEPRERPGESGDVHAARNTGEGPESADGTTEGQGGPNEDRPYSEWSKTELRAEIDERNEGREEDDRIPVSGTAADLAGRLIEDDEFENEE